MGSNDPKQEERRPLHPEIGPERPGSESPEPPKGWQPNASVSNGQNNEHSYLPNTAAEPQASQRAGQHEINLGHTRIKLTEAQFLEFKRSQSLLSVSQICAVVSLFLGGVLLGSIGLGLAISGLLKIKQVCLTLSLDSAASRQLTRYGIVAVVMCALALVLNILSLIVLYPTIMQIVQSGDYSSLFGSGATSAATSSTWG